MDANSITLDDEVLKSHRALSDASEKFLYHTKENPATLDRSQYRSLHWYDERLKLQSWPVFRNQRARRQFQEASLGICHLVKHIPRRLFNNDIDKISSYYGIPRDVIALQLDATNDEHIDTLLARGDFILSDKGLKCIEFNVSSDLGGMEKPIWEAMYLNTPVIDDFIKKHGVVVRNENLLTQLLKHVTGVFREKHNDITDINIVFTIPGFRNQGDRSKEQAYLQNIYNSVHKGHIVFADYHHLKIREDGVYCCNNKRIHILVEIYGGIVSAGVIDHFKKGNIHIYNGPVTRILSNKFNLVLLSENLENDMFTPRERDIIKKYVPWTRKIQDRETRFQGNLIRLRDFILERQRDLVIKPAVGYGGIDVFIGKNTPKDQWKEIVQKGMSESGWLVQEFFESLPFLCQAGDSGACRHHIIWGEYVFGSKYLGGWVRFLPEKDCKGVINRKQGAEEGVIFELNE